MSHITGEVIIRAPVDAVFDMVADERNEPTYNRRIVRAEKLSEGPIEAGCQFVAQPGGRGAKGEMILTILEYDRPHRLHDVIRSSYLHVDGTLSFDEVVEGTRLTWDWNVGLVGPMRILAPVLALVGPGWERRNWMALKRHMESSRR
jgi:hypothetical protein